MQKRAEVAMEADSTSEKKTKEIGFDGADEVSSCSSSHVPLRPCEVSYSAG